MARNRTSLVKLRGNTYYENFTVNGHRFRESLHTDDKDNAEIIAAKTRSDALLGHLTGKKLEMAFAEALARDWVERAQHLASSNNIKGWAIAFQDDKTGLGRKTLLSEITTAGLVTYRTHRRVERANVTINTEFGYLRTVFNRARKVWKVETPDIEWKEVFLEVSERERELSRVEEERLFQELRPDYHPMVLFALVAGARLANVIGLKWEQVDWEAGRIVFRTKSKKKDGKIHHVPITKKLAAILSAQRGLHPIFVFTYICRKDHYAWRTGARRPKGERYPFTRWGWRREWLRALKKVGIWNGKESPDRFRFHDLRHTAATRVLRKTGNIKTVQRMLGHSNITTTMRYAHVLVDDVREAMEDVDKAQSRHKVVAIRKKKVG
jgi:integrase